MVCPPKPVMVTALTEESALTISIMCPLFPTDVGKVKVIAGRFDRLVGLPRSGPNREERQARRNHKAFLAARKRHVDPPAVGVKIGGTQTGDGIDQSEGTMGADGSDQLLDGI